MWTARVFLHARFRYMRRLRQAIPFAGHVVLPVAVGAFIYIAWRVDTLLVFGWCRSVGINGPVCDLRQALASARSGIPGWVMYSLPDALWVYSATALQRLIWRSSRGHVAAYVGISLPLVLAVGGELGQRARRVPGTFCLSDLGLCVVAAVAAVVLTTRRRRTG